LPFLFYLKYVEWTFIIFNFMSTAWGWPYTIAITYYSYCIHLRYVPNICSSYCIYTAGTRVTVIFGMYRVEDKGSWFLWNWCTMSSSKLRSSYSPPWEPHISLSRLVLKYPVQQYRKSSFSWRLSVVFELEKNWNPISTWTQPYICE